MGNISSSSILSSATILRHKVLIGNEKQILICIFEIQALEEMEYLIWTANIEGNKN